MEFGLRLKNRYEALTLVSGIMDLFISLENIYIRCSLKIKISDEPALKILHLPSFTERRNRQNSEIHLQ